MSDVGWRKGFSIWEEEEFRQDGQDLMDFSPCRRPGEKGSMPAAGDSLFEMFLAA
jgi:hypothetical protein